MLDLGRIIPVGAALFRIVYPGAGLLDFMKAEGDFRCTEEPKLEGVKILFSGSVLETTFRSKGFNAGDVLQDRPSMCCINDFSGKFFIMPALMARLPLMSTIASRLNCTPQAPYEVEYDPVWGVSATLAFPVFLGGGGPVWG
jgi:hypothetical protein